MPAKSLAIDGKLVNTKLIFEKPLVGFSWLEARLQGCTFQGHLKENEFGVLSGSNGCCERGVFTDADLDDCTFYGDIARAAHEFPLWPNFVILDPHRHLGEMQRAHPCEQLVDVVDSIEFLDSEASATTYNAEALAKRCGLKPEEIKRFFSQFPFVRM